MQIYHSLLTSEGYVNLEYIERHIEVGKSKDYGMIVKALLENSNLRIRNNDLKKFGFLPSTPPIGNIIHAQEVAKSKGPNIYVACMPKSGSSFFKFNKNWDRLSFCSYQDKPHKTPIIFWY